MKVRLMLVMMLVIAVAPAAFGQNTYKIFDAVAITPSDPFFEIPGNSVFANAIAFGSKEIYLSCPAGAVSTLSGPNNTQLIVDNFLTVNGANAFGGEDSGFSGTFGDILAHAGQPMENAFTGVAPADVTGLVTSSGVYTFKLMDFGFSFGSTEVYLNTTCTLKVQICHRDNGTPQFKTLTVGAGAIQSHLSRHTGDYAGACTNQ